MVIGLVGPVAVMPGPVTWPPVRAVTVYEVNGAPTVGGVNATVAWRSPAVTEVIAGWPGNGRGVTGLDGAERTPSPSTLTALTVKVYVTPLVSPGTSIGLLPTRWVTLPGAERTMYSVMGMPPSSAG